MKKVAVIGAGPAGIYASLLLAHFKGEVHLFDQNKDVGEKLKTTGGGRMNVTNKNFGADEFSSQSSNLLKKLFKNPHFANRHLIFESLGIEYAWEKNRALLASQNAPLEVARLKEKVVAQANLKLCLEHKALDIKRLASGAFRITFETPNNTSVVEFDTVILSGGGMFRMKDMGDTDKIYKLPLQLGHSLTDVQPSLSPLIFTDKVLRELKGISFEGILTDTQNKKTVTDDMIITHFGLSGPAVLDFSAFRESDSIELCFTSQIKENELRDRINTLRQGTHRLRGVLREYFTKNLSDFFLQQADLSIETVIADLPKAKLHQLIQTIFHYAIPQVQSKNYPSSWTTKGGVKLEEINTATLESKLAPGAYFAGEIMDTNGLCGGYNISYAAISAQIVADSLLRSQTKTGL
jgi:predicted Rossmann fold flavoprotein